MWSKLVRIPAVLLGGWKVYCFPHSYSNVSSFVCDRYIEGEYVPVITSNYMYYSEMLIVDFKNRIVHVIEGCRYIVTLKVNGNVSTDIFDKFSSKKYLVIDVYGNVLKLNTIYDLFRCVNSYPCVSIALEVKPCLKNMVQNDFEEDITLFLNKVDYLRNQVFIQGSVYEYSYNTSKVDSFKIAQKIQSEIEEPLREVFNSMFMAPHSPYFILNNLLEKLDLLYYLELNSITNLVSYYSRCGEKKISHIDKLKREIREIIDTMPDSQLEIIEGMLLSAQFEDEYFSYIVYKILEVYKCD